jgi:GNAT superfamily N-acetyltransferase
MGVHAHLRRLGPAELEPAAALFRDAFPLREDEVRTWTSGQALRYVAVVDRVVAYAALWPFHADGARMDVVVAPDVRRRRLGSLLLTHLSVRARAGGSITLQARADEDWLPAQAFLRVHGFAETMRMHRQVLDVASATIDAYREVETRLAGEGIEVLTLEQVLDRDPLCWQRFAELLHAAQEGWADPDPRADPEPVRPTEEFRRQFERVAELHAAETSFLAVHGDRYVGFSAPLGTGVRPDYRGRGIATALKVRVVAAAQARGLAELRTSSGNPAMLRVNERLGYRPTSTEVRLVKRLRPWADSERIAAAWRTHRLGGQAGPRD